MCLAAQDDLSDNHEAAAQRSKNVVVGHDRVKAESSVPKRNESAHEESEHDREEIIHTYVEARASIVDVHGRNDDELDKFSTVAPGNLLHTSRYFLVTHRILRGERTD